ncbi:hypothetical protein QCA50_002001 [Cerrena zonata]|uniref:Uncharacterized protein n=1 Tax=Cerrena zonata TaxID=2478898 RepID=A0AAW0GMJ7_9APHY
MSQGPNAVQWLDTTFKSPERTAELLRPDLESGLITPNDYRTAVAFLPGPHRYYPVIYSATSTAAFAGFVKLRRWQLTSPRIFALGFVSNFAGLIWGQIERARVHYRFAHQLENPTGFSQALQNVNMRTGGKEPLRWALPGADRDLLQRGLTEPGTMGEEGRSHEDEWAKEPTGIPSDVSQTSHSSSSTNPPNTSGSTAATQTSRNATKWDEIRAANARGAQNSAWDVLRQQHERERMLERQQQQQRSSDNGSFASPPSTRYSDDDRAREQARFDAMLEAERRMSRE